MALATLGDIKTAVYARGFEDDQAGRIAGLASDVQREIINDNRWRFAVVTASVPATVGTAVYTLPGSPVVHHLESVRLVQPGVPYLELTGVDSDDLLELAAYGAGYSFDVLAVPDGQLWTELSPTTFQVYPPPTAAGTFTVRYLRAPVDLAADADVPLIPAVYLDLIVIGVCKHLAGRENQDGRYARYQAEFDHRLGKMKAQYALKQSQSSARVEHSGVRSYDQSC